MPQLNTNLSSKTNCSKKHFKISEFFVNSVQPIVNRNENIGNPSLKLETKFVSRSRKDPLGKGRSHYLHRNVLKPFQLFPEATQHTWKTVSKMRLSMVNFTRKIWSKTLNKGIVYIRVDFCCFCTTVFKQYTHLFYQIFAGSTESGGPMGGCNFRNILPINVPKCNGGKSYVLWQETFKVIRTLLPGIWSLPFLYGYCWSHEHSHSRKTQSQRKLYQS